MATSAPPILERTRRRAAPRDPAHRVDRIQIHARCGPPNQRTFRRSEVVQAAQNPGRRVLRVRKQHEAGRASQEPGWNAQKQSRQRRKLRSRQRREGGNRQNDDTKGNMPGERDKRSLALTGPRRPAM